LSSKTIAPIAAHYKTLAVTNGQEALDILEHRAVNFILTDLSMPVLDGIELIRILRDRREFDHIPIVALTASASRLDRQRVSEMGCVDVLTKPYRPKELLDLIGRHLPAPASEDNHVDHPALLRGDS
jgi:CheY-like chemotaxis protein